MEENKRIMKKKMYVFHHLSSIEETLLIEKRVNELDDIHNARFNVKTNTLILETHRSDLHQIINDIAYQINENIEVQYLRKDTYESPVSLNKILFLSGLMMLAFALGIVTRSGSGTFITYPAFIVAYIVLGYEVLKRVYNHIKLKNFIHSDNLIILSTLLALFSGRQMSSFVVLVAYQFMELVFPFVVDKCQSIINANYKTKLNVSLRKEDGCHIVPYQEVKVGDVLELVNHETAHFTGTIVEGHALVDTFFLDGNKEYTTLSIGDQILDSTVIVDGHIAYRVEKPFKDNSRSSILRDYRVILTDPPSQFYRFGSFIRFIPYLMLVIGIWATYVSSQEFGISLQVTFYRASYFLLMAGIAPFEISLQNSVLSCLSVLYKNKVALRNEGGHFSKLLKASYVVFDMDELNELTKENKRFLHRFKYLGKILIVFTNATGDDFDKMKKFYRLHHLCYATTLEAKMSYLSSFRGEKVLVTKKERIKDTGPLYHGVIALGGFYDQDHRENADFILGSRDIKSVLTLYRTSVYSTYLISFTFFLCFLVRFIMIYRGYHYTTNLISAYGVEVCLSLFALIIPIFILKNKKIDE